jgi:hypothetical protein
MHTSITTGNRPTNKSNSKAYFNAMHDLPINEMLCQQIQKQPLQAEANTLALNPLPDSIMKLVRLQIKPFFTENESVNTSK